MKSHARTVKTLVPVVDVSMAGMSQHSRAWTRASASRHVDDGNGVAVTRISNDAVFEFVMEVAAGSHDIDALAPALRRLARGGR